MNSSRSIAGRQRIAETVIGEIARERRIPIRDLVGVKRYADYVAARRLIAKQLTDQGFEPSRIAEFINRDRSTVIYYLRTGL